MVNNEFKKECIRCLLTNDVPDITFDDHGVCSTCKNFDENIHKYTFSETEIEENLIDLKTRLKRNKLNEYDCLIGLSGGVDSSYIALMAHKLGLNPLCVHFDNGWNSETAVKNINKIINKTGFDLYTYVIDWDEFCDLQRSFLKAGVIDIEMLTDHAIFATLVKILRKFKIKSILSGTNFRTEHGMPPKWTWSKMDWKNISNIQKQFGSLKIKSFPHLSTFLWVLMKRYKIGGIYEEPLNFINYRKNNAIHELNAYFDWEYYGGKHYESVFTRFYQEYILPRKFNVDKKIVHFSDLIRNNELTKNEALEQINNNFYSSNFLNDDYEFVTKKLLFTAAEFDKIINDQPVSHLVYGSDVAFISKLSRLKKIIGI